MCLVTSQYRPKIATAPITVYKELRLDDTGLWSQIYKYKWGLRTQRSKLSKKKQLSYPDKWEVGQGFHSYKNRPTRRQWYVTNVWVEAVMPKGAKYYESVCGKEIASNQLRMLNKCWSIEKRGARTRPWKNVKK